MEVLTYPGGPFQENGYLLICPDSGTAAVVDPGATAPEIARDIRSRQLDVEAVFLTHAHLDHVEGLPDIRAVTDAPIHLHPGDRPLFDAVQAQAAAFGLHIRELPPPDEELIPGRAVGFGSCSLEVRFTPGHAPGHVIFYSAEYELALVGDVVFQGSIGRTDLPGGDFQTLMRSIREQVLTLPDETRLFTGHGGNTTVGLERRGNPFLIPHYGGEMA
jgi:glyoxylase-like metal-dependent hydrolase (beta-lactamase superfamily II)